MKIYLGKKNLLIATTGVLIVFLLIVVILFINNINSKELEDTQAISYPNSYVTVLPSSYTQMIIPRYSAEIIHRNEHYSLMYTNDEGVKEIYKWEIDPGYGIGGTNCTGIKYSQDRRYFVACVSSAEVVSHQSIPLIFDFKGNLVTDLINLKNFIYVTKSYSDSRPELAGQSFPLSENSVKFNWFNNDELLITIKGQDQIYKIGDTILSEVENPCLKIYSNSFFPTFSFKYDSCFWEVSEEVTKENTASDIKFPLTFNVLLKDNLGNLLKFNLFTPVPFGFYSETSCYSNEVVNVSNKFERVTTDNLQYSYLVNSMIIKSGTTEFDSIKQNPPVNYSGLPINSETKFCLQPNLEMGFRVPFTGSDLGLASKVSNPDSKLTTFFNIYLDTQSSSETKNSADAIIQSLNY